MLGKLIKYEFKATARWILPLFGGVVFLSIVNKLMLLLFGGAASFNQNTTLSSLGGLAFAVTFMLYFMMVVAAFVITFVLMLRRYQSNLMGDEGYLMFTLPVSVNQHLIAKLLTASIWTLSSFAVTFFSIFILSIGNFGSILDMIMEALQAEFGPLFNGATLHLFGYMVEVLFSLLIGIPMMFLTFYLAITFAYTRQKNKLLYGIGAYFVLNFFNQAVSMIIILILDFIFEKNPSYTVTAFISLDFTYLHVILIVNLVLALIFSVLYYLATHHLLSKSLNME